MEIVFDKEPYPAFESYQVPLSKFLRSKKHQPFIILYRVILNPEFLQDNCKNSTIVGVFLSHYIEGCKKMIVSTDGDYIRMCNRLPSHNIKICSVEDLALESTFTFLYSEHPPVPISGLYNLQNMDLSSSIEGWEYTFRHLRSYHSEHSPIFLDTFIEYTFITHKVRKIQYCILPYRNPWVGIAHHTFENFLCFINPKIMFDSIFMESLKHCKGIICLSSYLGEQYRQKYSIPVHVIPHPIIPYPYRWNKWEGIFVSVGEWYRNTFSLSYAKLPGKKLYIQKYSLPFIFNKTSLDQLFIERNTWVRGALKYLRETHFPIGNFETFDLRKECPSSCSRHLYDTLRKYFRTTEIIPYLETKKYWELLCNSCVFAHFESCSASFLVMQCIACNIPILVNRHPALEEYLGVDYPLFYDDIEHINIQEQDILSANLYLSKLNKSRFAIDNFITEIKTFLEKSYEL